MGDGGLSILVLAFAGADPHRHSDLLLVRHLSGLPATGFGMRWYRSYWNELGWVDATILSVWIGLAVTLLSTALRTAAAITALVRGRFPGKHA